LAPVVTYKVSTSFFTVTRPNTFNQNIEAQHIDGSVYVCSPEVWSFVAPGQIFLYDDEIDYASGFTTLEGVDGSTILPPSFIFALQETFDQ